MGQLGEYVKMALKNIWANKVRTFLTMLGIIIGISSVILIISIGNGATGMISDQLGSIGKGQIAFRRWMASKQLPHRWCWREQPGREKMIFLLR